MDGFKSHVCCLPYRNVEHWRMFKLYFWASFAHGFCQRLYFGSSCQKIGHDPYLSLLALTLLGENQTTMTILSGFNSNEEKFGFRHIITHFY